MSLTTSELERFVDEIANSPQLWKHLVRHADGLRVYDQIWDDEQVNAWVICWSAAQDTGFHDHHESVAAIAVTLGEVHEDRLRLGAPPRSRTFRAGETFSVPAEAIHHVLHSGIAPAVTIHAYSPPLVRTGAYRVSPEGELQREVLSVDEGLRAEPALS
jgi:quercetin dioxygenase-like cupin family protein